MSAAINGDARQFTIRLEEPRDRPAVRAVIEAAFGRPKEADLVDDLRRATSILHSLVAEIQGAVVGHALYTRAHLHHESRGNMTPAAALGPLAVHPAHQRRGVGSALVRAGIERCKGAREPMLVVLGDPAYYASFGFVPAARVNLRCKWPGMEEAFMVLMLSRAGGSGAVAPGMLHYHESFDAV